MTKPRVSPMAQYSRREHRTSVSLGKLAVWRR